MCIRDRLFTLFIYAEIIGMVGAYTSSSRIPVTLPIIIAITALCRLIVMHGKDMDAFVLMGESGSVLLLSGAAYIMSLKGKLSLEKKKLHWIRLYCGQRSRIKREWLFHTFLLSMNFLTHQCLTFAAWALKPPLDLGLKPIKVLQTLVGSALSPRGFNNIYC